MDVKKILDKYHITPNPLRDQFFIQDEAIIKTIVNLSDPKRNDVILEIGAGIGNLTREIAKKVCKVIAFEIDERFKIFLRKLPKNVDIHFENAWNYVQLHGKFKKRKEYNKVVSNLPYSFAEQFLHNLTFLDYDKVILVVPIKFINKIRTNGVFSSFFTLDIKMYIQKEAFYPIPRTNSVVIDLIKLPDPIITQNRKLFLRQYIYQHENQLVKNSLMEGIIKYEKLTQSKYLTKNEARKIIQEKNLPADYLENKPDSFVIYKIIEENFI